MAIVKCAKCGTKNRVDEKSAVEKKPVCGKCGAELDISAAAPSDSSKPRVFSDATFGTDIAAPANVPVLVDAWAPWCGPCRMIAPILDQLAVESGGKYIIGKLNVDENPKTAAQFGIQSIPTLLLFKNGKLVDRIVGVQPKQVIAAKLASQAAAAA
jgi:thioredoxin 2